ncbi:amidohydrolase, partial [Bacillus tropicus]|nr:amidohydrolase [Bacillus tropicus]
MGEIWHGDTIYTMREGNEEVDAVYVEHGMIVDVGSKEGLESRYAAVTLHNLEGKTMIPGLVDSHMNLIAHGERLLRLDLSNCASYS